MQVFWVFPEIEAREKKPRRAYRGQHHKYDHWQMLMDRMNGMPWADIEKKYGVPSSCDGRAARNIVCNSIAIRKLSPKEVEAIFPRMV